MTEQHHSAEWAYIFRECGHATYLLSGRMSEVTENWKIALAGWTSENYPQPYVGGERPTCCFNH